MRERKKEREKEREREIARERERERRLAEALHWDTRLTCLPPRETAR